MSINEYVELKVTIVDEDPPYHQQQQTHDKEEAALLSNSEEDEDFIAYDNKQEDNHSLTIQVYIANKMMFQKF